MSARLVGGFAYTVRVCTNIKDAACPGSRHLDIATFLAEYWTYLTIPAVSAVVGFGTNWLAVKMMMYPPHAIQIEVCSPTAAGTSTSTTGHQAD